MVNIEPG